MNKVLQLKQLLQPLQTDLHQNQTLAVTVISFSHHSLRNQLQRPGQCANAELHGVEDGENGEGLRGLQLHLGQSHGDEGGKAGNDGDGGRHCGAHGLQHGRLPQLLDLLLAKSGNSLDQNVIEETLEKRTFMKGISQAYILISLMELMISPIIVTLLSVMVTTLSLSLAVAEAITPMMG